MSIFIKKMSDVFFLQNYNLSFQITIGNIELMIAAFGEILFDMYPGEEHLGGAPFNFIYHIHKLTGGGSIISRIGNDERGKNIQQFLSLKGMDQRFLQIDKNRSTGTVSVRLNGTGIPTFSIEDEVAYDFIEAPPDFEKEIELLYFGTLAQRSVVSRNALQQLSGKTRRRFLDMNLRQRYYTPDILQQSFAIADIVKLNLEELQTIHPLFFSEPFELKESAQLFLEKFTLSHVAVTMGEGGSWMLMNDESHFCKTKTDRVVDTVGAGDGFSALMCLGILRGWPLEQINRTASEFSTALCGTKGAVPENDEFYEPYRRLANPDKSGLASLALVT